jgi:hypothetical protein
MNDIDRRLADWNPVPPEEVVGRARSLEAAALLRCILEEPVEHAPEHDPFRRARVSRRGRWAGGLAAGVAAIALITTALWPSGAARVPGGGAANGPGSEPRHLRLVDFTNEGDEIAALITDPDAAASQLTAVFQAHRLNIHVNAVPVSPSLVGTIVYTDAPVIRSLQQGTCLAGGTGCQVGLVIPSDFSGEAFVTVGRAARAGETYGSSDDVFGPGEALHCSGILGRPVAEALPVLEQRGLSVRWQIDGQNPPDQSTPGGYVIEGIALSSTEVMLDTSAQLPDTDTFRRYESAANTGC